VVACAAASLAEDIASGRFRRDLGERLTLIQLQLPDPT
jgi:DNA-binding NtrC family response regulator